jgi:hypothetical protein
VGGAAVTDFAEDFVAGGALLGGLERADGSYLNTLSASSISMLLTCPEKFRLSYMLQRWPKANAATTLGHAYHHALQRNFEQKVYSKRDLTQDEVLDAYDEGWGQALDREQILWRDDDPGATKTLGAEMVKIYHRLLSPLVHPIAVEERFEQVIADCPLPLVGRVDLMEAGRIVDRKTDKQGATKAKPEWRVQALCYLAAFPGKDFAWHVQSKNGALRTYGPEKNKGLILHGTPGKVRTGRMLVQKAWESLQDYYGRYGLDEPWPGVALAHPYACFSCSHRSGCVYWT